MISLDVGDSDASKMWVESSSHLDIWVLAGTYN